jgi:multidrug efflux pump subunit AcrB
MLSWALEHRPVAASAFVLFFGVSAALFPMIGRDFFPSVDAGQLRLHVRAPHGTRIEETERWFAKVEEAVRDVIPKDEVQSVIQNIGIPYSGINLALSDGSQMSPAEGELLISLAKKRSRPAPEYAAELRGILAAKFPELTLFFQPPDMVTQVLNFGLPAPIDVQVVGPRGNLAANAKIAQDLAREIARIPGAVDVHLQQVVDTPEVRVDVDRTMANQLGLSQREVASDALIALSSSGQTAPNFWTEPASGVQYAVAVQTPQYKIDSIAALANLPSANAGLDQPQLLGNLAEIRRSSGRTNATHYNLSPTFDVLANVHGSDLSSVANAVEGILARARPTLPRGTTINVRGQVADMNASFRTLSYGLVLAALLVYLLMVVNFQSWLEPFIILMALPGALSGILWMLFVTGTTVSVPALMGAIMCIGVATSNSILMVTFANEQQRAGVSAVDAAWSAGVTRFRPVIMTALAMIIGMLPMSLGLSEGGEQNAPLGRAVIGGLVAATAATLFFVPIVFSVLRRRAPRPAAAEEALLS